MPSISTKKLEPMKRISHHFQFLTSDIQLYAPDFI